MTCIAGLVHEGEVWLASDAQSTWGWVKHDCGSKVSQKGELAVAFTGPCAVAAAFENRFTLPDVPEDKSKHDRWFNVQVPDAIKSCLSDSGLLKDENGIKTSAAYGIMAWRGRLCSFDGYFACYPATRGYVAHGSGGEVAMGSLFSTEGKSPEERLRIAVNAANVWSSGCGVNVHVVKVGEKPSDDTLPEPDCKPQSGTILKGG